MTVYEVIEINDRTDEEDVIIQTFDYDEALSEKTHHEIMNYYDYIRYELFEYIF